MPFQIWHFTIAYLQVFKYLFACGRPILIIIIFLVDRLRWIEYLKHDANIIKSLSVSITLSDLVFIDYVITYHLYNCTLKQLAFTGVDEDDLHDPGKVRLASKETSQSISLFRGTCKTTYHIEIRPEAPGIMGNCICDYQLSSHSLFTAVLGTRAGCVIFWLIEKCIGSNLIFSMSILCGKYVWMMLDVDI